MWLTAFGSAIHKMSSWTHVPIVSVKSSIKGQDRAYPENAVPTNDIPEFLEESLLRSSSFFREKIPLVSLEAFTFSTVLQEEVIKGRIDIPKSQDGFTGPGTSLIVESLLCLRKMAYAMTTTQVASAPSRYSIAGSLFKLPLWSRVRRTELLID